MTQYARRNVTSSFDDIMQQWLGQKYDGNFPLLSEEQMTNIYVSFGKFCF